MTGKRFKIYNKETLDTYIEDTQDCYSDGNTKTYWFWEIEDFCDLFKKLNELSDENEQLKQENEEFNEELMEYDSFKRLYEEKIERVEKENEQLKQRNDRQAKQLDRLYSLIEEKDWRALNDILDDFKRCDEQLQKEWGTYGDVE